LDGACSGAFHVEHDENHENSHLRYKLTLSIFEQLPYVHSVATTLASSVFKEFGIIGQFDVASNE
jgi:hypothetical protein